MLVSIVQPAFTGTSGGVNQEDDVWHLDVVFCLDLSGSTNGLIDNVRENIWGIVNLTSSMRPETHLRIGVVGYSRPSFGKNDFYVKTLSKLTDDFDELAFELNKLKTSIEKGDQFVSNALEVAGMQMNWTKEKQAVRLLFLVGNGNVDTGSSDYRTVTDEIRESGIQLVPVYCLRQRELSDEAGWEQIGRISGNSYEQIWITKRDPFITAGQGTDQLKKLHYELDKLALPVGKEGQREYDEMKSCDDHSLGYLPHNYEDRLYYRISKKYLDGMAPWDLVSDTTITTARLSVMEDIELAADSINGMSGSRLAVLLEKMRTDRRKVISQMRQTLPVRRQSMINGMLLGNGLITDHVLERIVLFHIVKQCQAAGITPVR